MDYLKRFLINLVLIIAFLLIVYIALPGITGLVYQATSGIYGPLAISVVIVAALPYGRKKKVNSRINNKSSNIPGESANKLADKRYIQMIIYVFLGVGIFLLIGVMINNSKTFGISSVGILILLSLLKILPNLFNKFLDKKGKEITRARKGAKSEKIVDNIFDGLPDQYFVINDVVSDFGNIDHVIIKRNGGVFLIETKSHHGRVSFQDKAILINGQFPEKDFIAQTLNNAYWLRERIKQIFESNVWIFPVIVFTNAFVPFTPPIKGIHIVNLKFLINTLEKINNDNPLNEQIWKKRESIYRLLKET